VEALVYVRVRPGMVPSVAVELRARGIRRAVIVVSDWDVLALAEGSDMQSIARNVIGSLHQIDGIEQTLTVPIVPTDRIGDLGGGFAMISPPTLTPGDACYVHVRAGPGAVPGIVERLSEMDDVAGVAALAGDYDVVAEIRAPWEVASGVVLESIHQIPGVVATKTMVAVDYDEPDDDRDQFSTWS
jgi:DNA-binding Lrp family transcriptional regulator